MLTKLKQVQLSKIHKVLKEERKCDGGKKGLY